MDAMTFLAALTAVFGLAATAGGLYKFGREHGARGTLIAGGLAVLLIGGSYVGYVAWTHFHSPEKRGKFQPPAAVFAALKGDLEKLPEARRSRRRYLTLTELANHPAVSADLLRCHREALTRVMQALAASGEPVLTPVDAEGTVFAFDLDRLGWTDTQWVEVLRCYPYALKHDQDPDEILRGMAQAVYEETDCGQPAVRGDWFLLAVARSPLGATVHKGVPPVLDASLNQLLDRVAAHFHSDLAPATAAAELGLPSEADLTNRLSVTSAHDLEPVVRHQPIRRTQWEAVHQGLSLFQRAARTLQLGSPYRQL